MPRQLADIVAAAGQAANAGRWAEAERLWKQVLQSDPENTRALGSLAIHALQRGETKLGIKRLENARRLSPSDLFILTTLIDVYSQTGELQQERNCIEAALASDPYFVPALLARGNWFERVGRKSRAASDYANALKISPAEAKWPDAFRVQLGHAQDVVASNAIAMTEHLTSAISELHADLPPDQQQRWREAVSIRAGNSTPYLSDSNQLYVPRLPAIPFFERDQFPFLAQLESRTKDIRREYLQVREATPHRLQPYIAYEPGQPVNQWQELDHSDRWSAFHLWTNGSRNEQNLERCPVTASTLQSLPLADISGVCPNVLFSSLAPATRIPPHTGESNARLVAHLPLIIPDNCRYRVGFEWREWRVGECLVFDDTIEHEAINDSDELRVILIFDVWNPLLSDTEKQVVSRLAEATRDYAN